MESKMRNRKIQREIRREAGRETPLERHNAYGNRDPTPYQAVKNIIKKGNKFETQHRMHRIKEGAKTRLSDGSQKKGKV